MSYIVLLRVDSHEIGACAEENVNKSMLDAFIELVVVLVLDV